MKLNLCSGQRPFDRVYWCNVDMQEEWKPDLLADCSSLSMFGNGSVEMVVIHQGLEHFGCGEGADMIKECYRVLQSGGSLIVSVPDMLKLARLLDSGELTDQIYMTNIYGAWRGNDADRHKWGYTHRSLVSFLMGSAPWMRVQDFDYREIKGADIARDDKWILAIEVIK